jgi:hypothetical protein
MSLIEDYQPSADLFKASGSAGSYNAGNGIKAGRKNGGAGNRFETGTAANLFCGC